MAGASPFKASCFSRSHRLCAPGAEPCSHHWVTKARSCPGVTAKQRLGATRPGLPGGAGPAGSAGRGQPDGLPGGRGPYSGLARGERWPGEAGRCCRPVAPGPAPAGPRTVLRSLPCLGAGALEMPSLGSALARAGRRSPVLLLDSGVMRA